MLKHSILSVILSIFCLIMLSSCVSDKKQQKELLFEFIDFRITENSAEITIKSNEDFGEKEIIMKAGSKEMSKKCDIKKDEKITLTVDGIQDESFTVECKIGKEKESFEVIDGLPQLSQNNVDAVIKAMTLEEKTRLSILYPDTHENNIAGQTYEIERLGIKSIQLADGTSGLRLRENTVAYPSMMNLANTWSTDLIYETAESEGKICRLYDIDILLSPGVNIQKNSLNGRNFEYLSEDPMLAGIEASAYINGLQSTGVGASVKHYALNSQETARGSTSSDATERAIREIYVRQFEYLIKHSSPYSLMTAYNKVNGKYLVDNEDILGEILRNEFGYDGLVETDWGAGGDRALLPNNGENIYAGIDTIQNCNTAAKNLQRAVESGKVSEETLDKSVRQILQIVAKSNKYNDINVDYTKDDARMQSRKAAAEGMVLLKNDNALPVNNGSFYYCGNVDKSVVIGGYGSSYVVTGDIVSISDGLNNAGFNVTTIELESAAESADNAIFIISRTSTEGADHPDIKGDFFLTDEELEQLKQTSNAFRAKGKKLIVLINTAIPINVSEWEEYADAIIFIGLAGEQVGNAVADVITGKVNPSGKLTQTWPVTFNDTPGADYFPGSASSTVFYEDIYVGYRFFETFDVKVSYPFGYGLSYTNFKYSGFSVKDNGDTIKLSVKVKNTGKTAGKEAVQFYVTIPDGLNEHPALQLCGFGKTKLLKPGASQTVSFEVDKNDLKTYNTKEAEWFLEGGDYVFAVGKNVSQIEATKSLKIEKKIIEKVKNIFEPEIDIISKETGKKLIAFGQNDIAEGKNARSNFSESNEYVAGKANDGIRTTRWSAASCPHETAWWYVDLEKEYNVENIRIIWESNTGKQFDILASLDGKNWTKVNTYDYNGQVSNLIFEKPVKARYIKFEEKSTGWLSILSFRVFGKE